MCLLFHLQIKSKNVRQCVEFYYNWKKMLPDEYRRMRTARRRRQQDLVTRSKSAAAAQQQQSHKVDAESQGKPAQSSEYGGPFVCPYPACGNVSFLGEENLSCIRIGSCS